MFKKALKFAGIFSFVLALVAFILLMATHGVTYAMSGTIGKAEGWFSGIAVLFGKGEAYSSGSFIIISGGASGTFDGKGAPMALIGWILIIVAMVALCAGVVLPLLKAKNAQKVAGLLNLVAAFLLVVGGVLLFFSALNFAGANEFESKYFHLGAGWIIAAILALVGGVVALLPACVDFLSKRK